MGHLMSGRCLLITLIGKYLQIQHILTIVVELERAQARAFFYI